MSIGYFRVWRSEYFPPDDRPTHNRGFRKLNDQPVGVACVQLKRECWIKMDGKWNHSRVFPQAPHYHQQFSDDSPIIWESVSDAEYESDLAFELWPKLSITYRPIRRWLRNVEPYLPPVVGLVVCATGLVMLYLNAGSG